MFKVIKDESGITLIVLVTVIIIILVIAGAAIYEGKDLIKDAKMETLETDMLEVKAKAKVIIEEIEAKTWATEESNKDNEINILFTNNYKMSIVSSLDSRITDQINVKETKRKLYKTSQETLKLMGLNELANENEEYIIAFDSSDYNTIDIIIEEGIKYKDNRYYTLSAIQEIFSEK